MIPSSKCTVDDWYERYQQTTDFDSKSSDEIRAIMDNAGIEYVLVDSENAEKLDRTTDFSIFLRSQADSYRIYKRNG